MSSSSVPALEPMRQPKALALRAESTALVISDKAIPGSERLPLGICLIEACMAPAAPAKMPMVPKTLWPVDRGMTLGLRQKGQVWGGFISSSRFAKT